MKRPGGPIAWILVLAAALLGGFGLWRGVRAPPAPRPQPRPRATAERPSLLTVPLVNPGGALSIRGRVLGPEGPVGEAAVIATGEDGEDLGVLESGCRNAEALLDGTCALATRRLAELAEQHQGEAPALARALSRSDGDFELTGLPPGPVTLWAESAGRGIALLRVVPPGANDVELRLEAGVALAGQVVGDQGEPLAGATVTALSSEHRRYFDGESGSDGQFLIGPAPAGAYTLVATAAGRMSAHARADLAKPPRLQLFTELRLAGRVVRDGRPVAGATVETAERDGVANVTTDGDGRFELGPLGPGLHTVRAVSGLAHGLEVVKLAPGQSREDVEVRLTVGGEIQGAVTDERGQPIKGAEVLLYDDESGQKVRTGVDGRYHLGPLAAGKYTLEASGPGRVPVEDQQVYLAPEERATLDFQLRAGHMLRGVVVNSEGAPVHDADLSIARANAGEEPVRLWGRGTSSGEDGAFEIDGLEPGDYQVQIQHARYRGRVEDFHVPGPEARVVLDLGAAIEGEVVDARGQPVAGVSVEAVGAASGRRLDLFSHTDLHKATTGGDGRFLVEGLEPGPHQVVATQEGAVSRAVAAEVDVSPGARAHVALRFADDPPITGRVVDPTGAPVQGVQVMALPLTAKSPLMTDAKTDAEGRFEIHGLAPGRYELLVTAPSSFDPRPAKPEAEPGGPPVTLVLAPQPRIHGHVRGEDGRPFTSFWIGVERFTSPDGAFELAEPSDFVQHIFAATGAAARAVTLGPGSARNPVEVVLQSGHRAVGSVVDATTHAAVAGADVEVLFQRGTEISTAPRTVARTGPDGAFVLGNVAPGDTLVVTKAGYRDAQAPVADDEHLPPIPLVPLATVYGTVERPDRVPRHRLTVLALGPTQKAAQVNPDRTYELVGLEAGEYTLALAEEQPGGFIPDYQPLAGVSVTVSESGRVRVDLQPRTGGAAVRVNLVTEAACTRASLLPGRVEPVSTREDAAALLDRSVGIGIPGRVEPLCGLAFEAVPPGHYTLLVLLEEARQPRVFTQELDVPATGPVSLEIALPAGTQQGR